jgi:D-alanyl-D-alanine carboxypeptidase
VTGLPGARRQPAGEKLTERQALEAMLVPSGNNVASLLARWDAGLEAAFVARMNTRARQFGLGDTRYADASGADPATVSTAVGQFRLTVAALQIPAFRQIVAMPQVRLPVVGLAYNVNAGLGHDGITGVKTGSSSQAGGCLAFAAIRTVARSPVMIVGVVIGVPATAAQPSELGGVISASENLLGSGPCAGHAPQDSAGPDDLGVFQVPADRRARRGRGHRGQRDRLARHPGHCHGDTPPARARDQPGPARCPGRRHDRRRGPPHHPGRQPGRAGTAGALAAHPAMSRPGALAGSGAWLALGCSQRSRTPARRAPLRPGMPVQDARARSSAWRRPGGDHAGGTGPAGGMLVTRSCHGFRRS